MLRQTRAFRIIVSALGVLCGVVCLLIIAAGGLDWVSLTKQNLEEPRNATPIEIAQAALEGQIEAMRKAGYDENCLFEVKIFGNLCINRCSGTGFALRLKDDYPGCRLDYCACEDEESGWVPDVPDVPDEPS